MIILDGDAVDTLYLKVYLKTNLCWLIFTLEVNEQQYSKQYIMYYRKSIMYYAFMQRKCAQYESAQNK